ncbi:hypothetical protein D3C85_1688400 [compost metagenome]
MLPPDQINTALQDVLILDERDLDLGLFDAIPVAVLTLVVAQNVQQRRLLRRGGEVDTLFLRKHGVVG